MNRRFHAPVLFLGLTLLLAGAARPVENVDLLIEHATVFVGDGKVLHDASVAIKAGRIHWVGQSDAAGFTAARRIDGRGRTVIPGLFDGHVHLMSSTYVLDSYSLKAYVSTTLPQWLEAMLLHGVTTIRTLGAPIRESLQFKEQLARGELKGPRVIASGPGLTSPRGHPAATMYTSAPDFNKRFVRVAASQAEARAAIAEVIDAGMESPLKLIYHGGAPGQNDYMMMGVAIDRLAADVLAAAVDEAHTRGYTVSVHTNDYEDALTAVLTGVDGLEHGVVSTPLADDRLAQAMLERDTFLVSTLRLHGLLHGPAVQRVAAENLKALHDRGIRIVAGSDTPVGLTHPGLNTVLEIEALVSAGLSEAQALEAATRNAAVSFGLAEELGLIAAGMIADMVVIDGDPTKDIRRLRFPEFVLQRGKVVRGEAPPANREPEHVNTRALQ